MNASLLFGSGYTLHSMHAALVLKAGVDAVARNHGDDFFQASDAGFGGVQHFDFPALCFGVSGVHTEDLGGEEGGFIPSGASANFDDDVLFVVGIFGEQQDFEFFFNAANA